MHTRYVADDVVIRSIDYLNAGNGVIILMTINHFYSAQTSLV